MYSLHEKVPIDAGTVHSINSVLILSTCLNLFHTVRLPSVSFINSLMKSI